MADRWRIPQFIEAFEKWLGARPEADSYLSDVYSLLVAKTASLNDHPGNWKPGELTRILLGQDPQNLPDPNPHASTRVVALRTYLEFLEDTGRFERSSLRLPDLRSELDFADAEYVTAMLDPSRWGRSKMLAMRAVEPEPLPERATEPLRDLPLIRIPSLEELGEEARQAAVFRTRYHEQAVRDQEVLGKFTDAANDRRYSVGPNPVGVAQALAFYLYGAPGQSVGLVDIQVWLTSVFPDDDIDFGDLIEALEDAGVATVANSGPITLTPLGIWYISRTIRAETGIDPPVTGPLDKALLEDVIGTIEKLPESEGVELFDEWAMAHGPNSAAAILATHLATHLVFRAMHRTGEEQRTTLRLLDAVVSKHPGAISAPRALQYRDKSGVIAEWLMRGR